AKLADKKTQIADLRNTERRELATRLMKDEYAEIGAGDILASPDCIIPMNKNATGLISRVLHNIPVLLGDVCDEVAAGIGTGGDKAFRIEDKRAKMSEIERDILHPVLIGREMNAYSVPDRTGFSIIYSTKAISARSHPNALEHLKPFQAKLSQKRETRKGLIPWWSLHWPRYPALFSAPKIVMRQTANSLYAAIDSVGYFCLNSIIIVRPKDERLMKYYIGLLNSRLLRWVYRNLTQEENRTFAEVKPINLRKLPIRTINLDDPADKSRHDKMVALVERMLDLHRQKQAAKSDAARERIEREINVTDEQIDALVYELYGLTEEEIKVVEEK
ncbi:MAG: hypothetical protein KGJ80_22135, partial [Chloroflexota bacterium]|nr:hypothetical protein [Chloroflexota bacterium]